MSAQQPQFLDIEEKGGVPQRRIAYIHEPGSAESGAGTPEVGFFWLSGFKSDMASTKATELAAFAGARGFGCTRFDYSGHGLSSGSFEDGTIGAWLDEAEAVFCRATRGTEIVVGSSMGGYIALLLLRRLLRFQPHEAKRIKALVLIAPAWDMTEELMWKVFSPENRRELMDYGVYRQPSPYDEPYAITRRLIEEGRNHLLARVPFNPGRPVVILQGALDQSVPIAHARELLRLLTGGQSRMIEIPDGEHRLSRPPDLELLFATLDELAQK